MGRWVVGYQVGRRVGQWVGRQAGRQVGRQVGRQGRSPGRVAGDPPGHTLTHIDKQTEQTKLNSPHTPRAQGFKYLDSPRPDLYIYIYTYVHYMQSPIPDATTNRGYARSYVRCRWSQHSAPALARLVCSTALSRKIQTAGTSTHPLENLTCAACR